MVKTISVFIQATAIKAGESTEKEETLGSPLFLKIPTSCQHGIKQARACRNFCTQVIMHTV